MSMTKKAWLHVVVKAVSEMAMQQKKNESPEYERLVVTCNVRHTATPLGLLSSQWARFLSLQFSCFCMYHRPRACNHDPNRVFVVTRTCLSSLRYNFHPSNKAH